MRYDPDSIRQDLKRLGVAQWDWAGIVAKLPIDLATGKQPVRPATDATEEMVQYCWCAYDKAFKGSGDQVIGRVDDLKGEDLYKKVAGIVDVKGEGLYNKQLTEIVNGQTLFTEGTKGNLLKMDKWARVVNDSWILGGIHRQATFRLISPRVMENLWNFSIGIPVVTAREILGLLHFGYNLRPEQREWFVKPVDPGRAAQANLLEYDRLMQNEGTIRSVLKLVDQFKLKDQMIAGARSHVAA